MSAQRFLAIVIIACVVYIIFYKLSEKHWCLLIDHNYGYSIEFPANRVVDTFGERGNHGFRDQKAIIFPRTLAFLQTNMVNIYWTNELKNTNEAIRSWGREQFANDWKLTSDLELIQVGQSNYEAWTMTFRRGSWQSQYYYIPRENGAFLIEFTQLGNQSHLNSIETHMLTSFLINDAFITDRASSFERRTIECIR